MKEFELLRFLTTMFNRSSKVSWPACPLISTNNKYISMYFRVYSAKVIEPVVSGQRSVVREK